MSWPLPSHALLRLKKWNAAAFGAADGELKYDDSELTARHQSELVELPMSQSVPMLAVRSRMTNMSTGGSEVCPVARAHAASPLTPPSEDPLPSPPLPPLPNPPPDDPLVP